MDTTVRIDFSRLGDNKGALYLTKLYPSDLGKIIKLDLPSPFLAIKKILTGFLIFG